MTSQDNSQTNVPVLVLDGGALPDRLTQMGAAATPPCRLRQVMDLDQSSDPVVLVVLTGAVTELAGALAAGGDPAAVLERWQSQAQDWLRLLRRHRGRVAVLERGALQAAPGACARALGPRLPLPEIAAPAPTAQDMAYGILARALLGETPSAQRLEDELQAMTHGASAASPDVPAAVTHLAAALRQAVAPAPDSELEQLLLEDIAGLQAELERMTLDLQVQQSALEAAETRLGLRLEAARAREAVVAMALVQDGGGPARLRAELAETQARLAQVQSEAEARLSELHASTSWKVTAPLRAVRRGLGGT